MDDPLTAAWVNLEEKTILAMVKERLNAEPTGLTLAPECDAPVNSYPEREIGIYIFSYSSGVGCCLGCE
jgi:hypothetical protein